MTLLLATFLSLGNHPRASANQGAPYEGRLTTDIRAVVPLGQINLPKPASSAVRCARCEEPLATVLASKGGQFPNKGVHITSSVTVGTFASLPELGSEELFTVERTEAHMTFKISDVGNEAQVIEIAERLSENFSGEERNIQALDFDFSYLDAAKTMLASLSSKVVPLSSGTVALTEQQIETYLDFDPDFLEAAKDMLRVFIEKTDRVRNHLRR